MRSKILKLINKFLINWIHCKIININIKDYELIKIVINNTMLPDARLINIIDIVKYCENNNIKGAYVECGVWKGGGIGLMALTNLMFGQNRREIHLFDSFEEICMPDEKFDGPKAIKEVEKFKGTGKLQPLIGLYDRFGGPGTIEECKELLNKKIKYPEEYVTYHKGWFQNTLPIIGNNIKEIAILRLDGDWYESTKICLDFLYDKVIDGGVVIVDDYGTYDGCKLAVDEFLLKRKFISRIYHVDKDCIYFIK